MSRPWVVLGVLAVFLALEIFLRFFQLPMRITWMPETAGYDYWIRQHVYARRSPLKYMDGCSFSVPRGLEFFRCNHRACEPWISPDAVRIVCLGGSTTWGHGVSDEETFPAQLEQVLRNQSDDRPYRVINLGLPGSTTHWGVEKGCFMADGLNPNLVVIGYGGFNDSLKVHFKDSELDAFSPLFMLLRSFYLYRIAEHFSYRYFFYPEAVQRVSPEEFRENSLRMVHHFRKKKIPVIFLGEWVPKSMQGPYGVSSPGLEQLRNVQISLSKELNVPHVDPRSCLKDDEAGAFLSDQIHWSKEGCRAIAACCAREMLNNIP